MATLTVNDLADLVTGTLANEERVNFTDISLDLQDYPAARRLLRQKAQTFGGGLGPKWRVKTTTAGSAKQVGLYEVDTLNVADLFTNATVSWVNNTANYSFDLREDEVNSGAAQLVDIVRARRISAMQDLIVLFETQFWSKPSTSSDKLNAFGIPYWVVKNASTGFNGGNPTGFSSGAGGISSSTYTQWANYTAQYTDVTKEDLIVKMRTAAAKTGFVNPVMFPDTNRGDRFSHMTTYSVIATMERILETQNDNLGNDVASKDGQVMFRGNPVEWVPYLDSNDSQNPIYGINWGVFQPIFLSGWYLRETPPTPSQDMHTVVSVHIDSTYNFRCTDRRRMSVIATA